MKQPATVHEKPNEVDVLIVGAGPIGLVMAIQLWTQGITNVRIIDKTVEPGKEQLNDSSRAIGIHARTLEMLEDLGITNKLIERGTIAYTASHFYDSKMMYRITYGAGCDKHHVRYPWNLMVTQGNTIDVLYKHLSQLGQEIEWETSLTSFSTSEQGATATIHHEQSGETEEIYAKWLLGCDGAHSIVRKSLNIDFSGHVYPERWVVCDLDIDWDIPHNDISFLGSLDAYAVALPLKGHGNNRFRVTMIQPLDKDDPNLGVGHALPTDQKRFTRKDCEEFFQKIYPQARVHCPEEAGNWFMIHCRLAEHYRSECCFLLGDAAHIHSPILGQGMNMGIQDACNLAWKLAAVLKGESSPSLLDSYEIERRAVAETVVKFTDKATKLVTMRLAFLQLVRSFVFRVLLLIPPMRRVLVSKLMQLRMTYSDTATALNGSSWVSTVWDKFRSQGPKTGDRCPDPAYRDGSSQLKWLYESVRGDRCSVLFFAANSHQKKEIEAIGEEIIRRYDGKVQPILILRDMESQDDLVDLATASSAQNQVVQPMRLADPKGDLHKAFGAYKPCVYVLRPDRHIGYRGHQMEDVTEYLANIFLPSTAPSPTIEKTPLSSTDQVPTNNSPLREIYG